MASGSSLSSERGFTMLELLVSSAVMVLVLGISTGVLMKSSSMFTQQRAAMDGRNSAAAGIDIMARLLRQSSCTNTAVFCQSILPDEDANGIFDTVRVRADWNPRDGALDDPYEDVYFVVGLADTPAGQRWTLFKREPTDAALVPFGEGVQSIRFAYLNQNGGPLANAAALPNLIGGVVMTVTTTPTNGMPAVISASTISVRRIK
jgi:prepilin-type N-terminal cleavage/methylation domain-containing protein